MGALFNPPHAPAAPPPPPNPQKAADVNQSITGTPTKVGGDNSGTLLTGPAGTAPASTGSKQLLGQ